VTVTDNDNDNSSLMVGDLLVEPALDKISRNLRTINLRPQVMELLVFLASNEGQVVSVEKLLDKLWSGRVVTDGTLYNCIGELRHAISSLDDTRSYIENIPKKGYRLSAAVENLREPPITPGAEGSSVPRINSGTRPRRRSILPWALPLVMFLGIKRTEDGENESSLTVSNKFILALVGGLFVAVAVIFYLAWPRDDRSIAVLPFEDISPGGDQAYLGNSIADELRLELQRLDGLHVAGRTSSIAYAQEDSKTIGEILNVDSIIEGSIRKEGNNVRITAQLTNVADGFTIWSESYNRKLENIFEMQEEIATSVAGALGVRLGVGTINAFRGAGTRNVEAYELYLQSQSNDWSKSALINKIQWLERAVELDPNYAAAWSWLGRITASTTWDVMPEQAPEIVDRAYPLALRGVQLNPESATAHSMLAMVRYFQFDWIGAEQSQTRAIELLADRPMVMGYGTMLMRSGRTAYAQKQFGIATTLEPLGGRPPALAWHASLAQGRFADAKEISNWQQGIDRIENNLDMAFNERDPEELKVAIRAMPKTNVATIELYAQVLAEFDSPERILSILRDVYLDENLQWVRKLHDLAMVAAYFGDPQFALKVKGEEVRASINRMTALWYPVMSEVRRLPEFKKLVIELNLVEYWRAYGWADACRPLGDDDFECS
jgi:TolB-like protein/DNA-binding winged helix-turn-helix (wHTH) protein